MKIWKSLINDLYYKIVDGIVWVNETISENWIRSNHNMKSAINKITSGSWVLVMDDILIVENE